MPRFINPCDAGAEGIVGVGDDLRPEILLWAYRRGIFPWPMPDLPLLWFCPPQRAVLDFDRLHIPERLARTRRNTCLRFTVDEDFPQVISGCQATPRPGQDATWITPAIEGAYTHFHRLGHAHSVEAWETDGTLVGGLYGVSVGGIFTGESLFYHKPNASKLALLHLIEHLGLRGLNWIDIQVMTPHMAALGARLIPRTEFLKRLAHESARGLRLFD